MSIEVLCEVIISKFRFEVEIREVKILAIWKVWYPNGVNRGPNRGQEYKLCLGEALDLNRDIWLKIMMDLVRNQKLTMDQKNLDETNDQR